METQSLTTVLTEIIDENDLREFERMQEQRSSRSHAIADAATCILMALACAIFLVAGSFAYLGYDLYKLTRGRLTYTQATKTVFLMAVDEGRAQNYLNGSITSSRSAK